MVIGAIMAPGERTVTTILRVMGLGNEKQLQNDHRVLNRVKWSSRALSRIVLLLLVGSFVLADTPIIVGIDETMDRRRGAKIEARGINRDPVRPSQEQFVKTSGLRWVCMLLLLPIRFREAGVGVTVSERIGPKRHATISSASVGTRK